MTRALCLSCGEIKFGAICPCPRCSVSSCGDMTVDIAFSDHHHPVETLRQFGAVIAALRTASDDRALCFWAFIHYISTHHPEILHADLAAELLPQVEELLSRIAQPGAPAPVDPANDPNQRLRRPWWQFWRS